MNDLFVCVKVDREERPDLDEIYMHRGADAHRGSGGWPLNVFLTPGGLRPFFGGTYFAPDERYGRDLGFPSLLQPRCTRRLERTQRSAIVDHSAARAPRDISSRSSASSARWTRWPRWACWWSRAEIARAVAELAARFDCHARGGFSPAPKFPP